MIDTNAVRKLKVKLIRAKSDFRHITDRAALYVLWIEELRSQCPDVQTSFCQSTVKSDFNETISEINAIDGEIE